MTSVLQTEPEFKTQESVKAQEFDMNFLNEQEEKGKRDIPEMGRLSTPKPIMHLGSSTEFQRPSPESSNVPKSRRHSRMGNSSSMGLFKPSTGLNVRHRPMTGAEPPVNRPMTAVRGAGYTSSHGGRRTPFDPLHEGAQSTNISELQKDDSPEERIRQQEAKIMQLIEEACVAQAEGENKVALTKAKEASNKERSLIRMQEQSGMGDHHNIDLTYAVLFTLANQYAANELYTEALNTYQMITKNRMFSNAYRLKVNMGNIYFKQGQYQKAVKMFRMALDQVPSSQKCLRIKIMHNIAMVFIQTGQLEEALGGLEYIMSEAPSHRAGLHLVACCRATEDRERMRAAFSLLLAVPLDVEDEEKYHLEQDSPEDALIAKAIQDDDLHKYETKRRQDAEYCILTAAKLIAPFVEDNFSSGYDWCVNAVKNSEYARLAANLEINKAVMHLKEDQLNEAIQALKIYEKDSNIVVSAAVNLSFIYYLQGDFDNALKYAEIVKKVDVKDANAYVNYGACLLEKGQMEEAVSAFEKALEYDPVHFEAIYNLGIALKRAGHYDEAMDCYQRFSGSLALLPEVAYQTADTLALLGDGDAAVDAFHRLLGLRSSDAAALKKLGELCDRLGDRRQAHHWYSEVHVKATVLYHLGLDQVSAQSKKTL
ncbi:unnamed protein product [Callosobruchus maculatus]|uniref:UDP-N-acetylglucosamine--peptide N-acetylglucosaminyltransferase SPINDLY n=1 Tax=Callosobruchus maculatus TaxID=64391 RepID=A0A653CE58_CALMS|nr:unnamed protein product [Callosobruchus maculatus]